MQVIIYQTNAFTELPFGGESTGVIPDATNLSDEDIHKIIRVLKLDRTAFIYRIDDENYRIRFFNRIREIKFCGYATISSFFTMAQKGYLDGPMNGKKRVYQHTQIGKSPIDIYFKEWDVSRVEMHKSSPTLLQKYKHLDIIERALKINRDDIGIEGKTIFPEIVYSGSNDMIIPVKRKQVLGEISPNYEIIKNALMERGIDTEDAPRVHTFSLNGDGNISCRQFEIIDRNIVERPCSGTGNAGLMFYLKRHDLIENRETLCYQGEFMDSPSTIYCEIGDSDEEYPIKIGGMGNVYFEGVITL